MFLYGWSWYFRRSGCCLWMSGTHSSPLLQYGGREESYQQKKLSMCLLCLLSTTAARRQPTTSEVLYIWPPTHSAILLLYMCVCESQTDRGMRSEEIKRDGLIINGCHFNLVIEEQWYCAFENNRSHAICFIFQQPSTTHMEVVKKKKKKEVQTNRPH